ncbi:unnamed protein product [Linum trigynum]|uniref:Stress-response A/B barrel domain-containing protein n=1 Tax=Linum trigynum TaxID=586398 RepID=A0AAV2G8U3_9ROSI
MLLRRALSSTHSGSCSVPNSHPPSSRDSGPLSFPVSCKFSLLDGATKVRLNSVSSRKIRMVSASNCAGNSSFSVEKTRKVVEHLCLLKTKKDLTEAEEKDMLDYLYTCQYQMRGIVAISVGRISNENVENYTHVVFMRFQRKEDVAKFYENPFYLGILKEHVTPHCNEKLYIDYESEVEDDIIPIFLKGEEYNYGLEFLHLIAFDESSFGAPVEDALASLARLTKKFPSLIVQSTHVVIRFRSSEAFELFMESKEYNAVTWRSKLETIIRRSLPIHFSVDPVGEEVM